MSLSINQAETLFDRYKVGLWRSVVEHGFGRYRKQPGKSDHRAATAASVIHDYMVAGARKVFSEDVDAQRIRFVEVRGADVTLMEIEESAVIWFKKLNRYRSVQSNRTNLSSRLIAGECDDIPGIAPAATLLHVGYTPNRFGTEVSRVSIVRPQGIGKKPEWYIDLNEPEADVAFHSRNGDGSGDGPRTALRLVIIPRQSGLIE
jgi:hypothetical protein